MIWLVVIIAAYLDTDDSIFIPGAIHHVITMGLNRQDIFLDDCDRNDFFGRLEMNLSLTGYRCYAWVQMSNRSLVEKLETGEKLDLHRIKAVNYYLDYLKPKEKFGND